MKIDNSNNNYLQKNQAELFSKQSLPNQASLQLANNSTLNANEDVLTLSKDSIQAYFESRANSQEKTITATETNFTRYQPEDNNTPSTLDITGFKNKVYDSSSDDLILVNGKSNKITSTNGKDELFVIGSRNQIFGENNDIQATLFGNSNQISITGSGALTATSSGINSITSDTGADSIVVDGKRNKISTGDGTDSIIAYGDEHSIDAGAGNDTIQTYGNSINISAGTGDDAVNAEGNGKINAGDGNDNIDLKGEGFIVNGGSGDDTIKFSSGQNTINGEDGNDTFQVTSLTGNVNISGGRGTDTVQLDIKREDYSVIAGEKDITFYNKLNHSEKLKVTTQDIELFKFSDSETLTTEDVRNLKGLSYQRQENSREKIVANTDAATNVFDLGVPSTSIIKSTETSSGVILSYKNELDQKKAIEIQNFSYLKLDGENYVDLKNSPNFEKLNTAVSDNYVITSETSKGEFKTSFYDKTSEQLLLSKQYAAKGSNFLLSDGSFLTADQLASTASGKSIDVTTDDTEVVGTSPTTNTANLKFSSSDIYKVDKTDLNSYTLTYKKNELETGTISFNNISLESINKNSNIIRNDEDAYPATNGTDAGNTEFKRIAYNLTGNSAYLTSLVGGDYENLSTEKKAAIDSSAAILENSINFTSDSVDGIADNSSKKLYSLRTANLLSNREDVLQNIVDTGLSVNFSTKKNVGNGTYGSTTYYSLPEKTKHEINLSLSGFYSGAANNKDSESIDIHETTHLIDFNSDENDNLPFGIQDSTATSYKSGRNDLFKEFNKTQESVGAIRSTGFISNKEFLSVATESFYERPAELESTSPLLYSSLKEYFNI